jgi:hypothetical protein
MVVSVRFPFLTNDLKKSTIYCDVKPYMRIYVYLATMKRKV